MVPENKSALDLLRDFKQNRRHLAIAVDEYGSTVGLVTAEDAIEQLAGEFEDEFDAPSHPVLSSAGGAVVMDGSVNLRDLETQIALEPAARWRRGDSGRIHAGAAGTHSRTWRIGGV